MVSSSPREGEDTEELTDLSLSGTSTPTFPGSPLIRLGPPQHPPPRISARPGDQLHPHLDMQVRPSHQLIWVSAPPGKPRPHLQLHFPAPIPPPAPPCLQAPPQSAFRPSLTLFSGPDPTPGTPLPSLESAPALQPRSCPWGMGHPRSCPQGTGHPQILPPGARVTSLVSPTGPAPSPALKLSSSCSWPS